MIVVDGGLGELGRLLFCGTGGGPITDDVRRDGSGLSCLEDTLVLEAWEVCEDRGTLLRSGAILCVLVCPAEVGNSEEMHEYQYVSGGPLECC